VNVSPDTTGVQRGLGVVSLIFFVLALERLINAVMAGSEAATRTAWILGAGFALIGVVLLGLLVLAGGAARPVSIDADTSSSHGRRER
jgi:hypothetical protein